MNYDNSRRISHIWVVALVIGAALVLARPSAAAAVGCPQTVSSVADVSTRELGVSSSVHRRFAQSFTAPCSGYVNSFQVKFGVTTGSPTGVVTWNFKGDENGVPGFVISSGTFTPTASAVNTLTISPNVFLNEGGLYWLELVSPSQSNNNYWGLRSTNGTSVYANGECKLSSDAGATWGVLAGGSDCYLLFTVGYIAATSTATSAAATATPSDTPTPTITLTPTPDTVIVIAASSGNAMTIDRTTTFGDIVTFGGILIPSVIVLVYFGYRYWSTRPDGRSNL